MKKWKFCQKNIGLAKKNLKNLQGVDASPKGYKSFIKR